MREFHHDAFRTMPKTFPNQETRAVFGETRRILVCGEDNPQDPRREYALHDEPAERGVAGHRLRADIFGLSRLTYLSIWRANLCSPTWSRPHAIERAAELVIGTGDAHPWNVVIMLGRKVADAVDAALRRHAKREGAAPAWRDLEPFASTTLGPGRTLVSIPHPSGRCHLWNDPANYARARELLRDVAPAIPWGELETMEMP